MEFMERQKGAYPLQLGLAYMFLAGYFARSLFVSLKLPASVGVMVSGFLFSYNFQEEVLESRNQLQELAFFLVLLTAGLDISLCDLKPHIFIMALLPATMEMLAIAAYAVVVMDFTWLEGLVLGSLLFAVGDGLVIPKMKEFSGRFKTHTLPHLVFVCVPLECSFALVVFGVLSGEAKPGPPCSLTTLIVANLVRLGCTVLIGAVLGYGCAKLIEARRSFEIFGRPVFTGEPVEAFIILVSVALLAFGAGSTEDGRVFLPLSFSSGSLLQPELMVIVIGAVFSDYVGHSTLHSLEQVLGGTWVFGQIVLFTMLGSRTSTGLFPHVVEVGPIIVVGLAFRLIGIAVALVLTIRSRPPAQHEADIKAKWASLLRHMGFCFLSTIPRATIQGALGQIPLNKRFFAGDDDDDRAFVREFMSVSSKLYVVLMAVCGMLMLNTFGPRILEKDIAQKNEYVAAETAGVVEVEETLPRDSAAVAALAKTLSHSAEDILYALHKNKLDSRKAIDNCAHDMLSRALAIAPEQLRDALHAAKFKDLDELIEQAEEEVTRRPRRPRTAAIHQFESARLGSFSH